MMQQNAREFRTGIARDARHCYTNRIGVFARQ